MQLGYIAFSCLHWRMHVVHMLKMVLKECRSKFALDASDGRIVVSIWSGTSPVCGEIGYCNKFIIQC